MCGILASFSNKSKIDNAIFKKALDLINYRGPDSSGIKAYSFGATNIILGHKRLSIIDASDRSSQPMEIDGTFLIFNGEIYNYKKLRVSLEIVGYKFKTTSDTEVLCIGLYHFGHEFISKIEGMFSFVYHDTKRNLIYAARDARGIKPLFTYNFKNGFSFSSEIRPLQLLHNNFKICECALYYYFQVGYTPPHFSIIEGITKVAPGEVIVYQSSSLLELYRYNTNETLISKGFNCDLIDAQELRDNVKKSIIQELVSDAPVGVLLSGGVDSSIIASIASSKISRLSAFTANFNHVSDEKFNKDHKIASKFTEELGIKHISVNINTLNLQNEFEEFYSSMDEPYANMTSFVTYKVSENAKRLGIKVLLSGDGSDELFGGYNRYTYAIFLEKIKYALYLSKEYRGYVVGGPLNKYLRFYSAKKMPKLKWSNDVEYNFMQKIINKLPYFLIQSLPSKLTLYDLVNWLDFFVWLPEESNQRVDRSSMRASIEVRVPFQSKILVDSYLNIPLKNKILNGVTKKVLKDAFSDIPKYILENPKLGWDGPYSRWFREDLKEITGDYFNSDLNNNLPFLDKNTSKDIFFKHLGGDYYKTEIRIILCYLLWLKGQDELKKLAS